MMLSSTYARRALVVTATLAAVLTATPAQAEVRFRPDRTGDAPAAIDLVRARYAYGHGRVAVTARVPELGRAGSTTLSISRFEIFEAGYVLRMRKKVGHEPHVRLYYFDHFGLNQRRCDDMAGSWGDGVVHLDVATTCLRHHARPHVFAQVATSQGDDIDRAPAVKRLARD